MVTLGGDCHKRTHTLVAVDDNGQQLGAKVVRALLSPRCGSGAGDTTTSNTEGHAVTPRRRLCELFVAGSLTRSTGACGKTR